MDTANNSSLDSNSKVVNWLLGNNFCAMPFVHAAIESNGDVRACCMSDQLEDDNGNRININDVSLTDALLHPAYKQFRESFVRNEQHPSCAACWKSNDIFSPRIKFSNIQPLNDYIQHVMSGGNAESNLLKLEVKAGNRCNLKCRICGLINSSQWLKETYDYNIHRGISVLPFKESDEYKYNQQCKWIDSDKFWTDTQSLNDIRVVHMMGGEPMMIPEHKLLLRNLLELPHASEIQVYYNTNATFVPDQELVDILGQFKKVLMSLSIDDIGERFEYQRKNASWDTVETVLDFFKTKQHVWNVGIDPAISIFNIMYLDDLIEYFTSRGFDVFDNHFVDSLWNIRSISAEAKQEITQHYQFSKHRDHHTIKTALDYMQADENTDINTSMRNNRIQFFDKTRNESFATTFPEMARIINYE
jgi:MoaA/NifB/PqqE/SkfB family radical SAM enzyme